MNIWKYFRTSACHFLLKSRIHLLQIYYMNLCISFHYYCLIIKKHISTKQYIGIIHTKECM